MDRVQVAATNEDPLEDYFAKVLELCAIRQDNLDQNCFMMAVANQSKVIVSRGSKLQSL